MQPIWDVLYDKFPTTIGFVVYYMPSRKRKLADILKESLAYTLTSEDADYARDDITDIAKILQRAITNLENGTKVDKDELTLLFAPTGDLQETTIENGWDFKYLVLTKHFDRAIERHANA